jgi:hypothetical protein
VLDARAFENGVKLAYIRRGKPVENAYIESFNGRFRDQCLNENFATVAQTRRVIEHWRIEYNKRSAALEGGLTDASSLCGCSDDKRKNRSTTRPGLQPRAVLKREACQLQCDASRALRDPA